MNERFALLIGAPFDDLRGVEGDLDRMEEVLPAYGFSCERLLGPAATRAGIIKALRDLESQTSPGDAVVIYYSGHGGQIENPRAMSSSRRGIREPSHYRCLIATDIHQSTAEDFRGVLSIELDFLVSAIADRSANVTVILDCCHSAGIIRDEPGVTLTLHRPLAPGARGHNMGLPWLKPVEVLLESLRHEGIDPHHLVPEADPRVLRLTACGPHEQAFETIDPRGHAGLLTTNLTDLLRAQAGRPTTWLSLATKVRQRVSALRSQHPTLKGPCDRLLFSLNEAPSRRTMSLVGDLARPILGAGAMAGVEVGDQLLLMPMTEGEAPVGEARVIHATASSATFALDTQERRSVEKRASSLWVTATPRHFARPRGELELSTSPEIELLIRHALPSSGIAAVATDRGSGKTIASIVEHSGTLHIKSAIDGPLLRSPLALRSFDDDHLSRVLRYVSETVELLALRHSLTQLAPSPAQTLDARLAEWSVAANPHERAPPPLPGENAEPPPLRLGAQRRVFITLRNARRLARPIYGWILWCCPSGQIQLLSQSDPWGSSVSGDACYVLGDRPGAEDRGLDLRWSSSLPKGGHRYGDLILIAADGYADLRPWERSAKPFLPEDPLSPQGTRTHDRTDTDAPLQKHAHRFAVWRLPVERG